MAVIYKATNIITGKAYIGYALNFGKRKDEHIRKALIGNGQYFHNAIKKYGEDNFDWIILKENATLEDEVSFITEYGTYWKTGRGYNLTMGGEGKLGYVTPEETKKKIAKSNTGRKPSLKQLETLRKNALKMKEIGHTEETKRKISEAHKGRAFTEEHKRNISLNHASKKETGSYYQSEEYKEKMSKACKGKIRTPEQREKYRLAALKREEGKRNNKV